MRVRHMKARQCQSRCQQAYPCPDQLPRNPSLHQAVSSRGKTTYSTQGGLHQHATWSNEKLWFSTKCLLSSAASIFAWGLSRLNVIQSLTFHPPHKTKPMRTWNLEDDSQPKHHSCSKPRSPPGSAQSMCPFHPTCNALTAHKQQQHLVPWDPDSSHVEIQPSNRSKYAANSTGTEVRQKQLSAGPN